MADPEPQGQDVQITRLPPVAMIELRLDAAARRRAEDILGHALPPPLHSLGTDDLRLFWNRPDGWLLSGAGLEGDVLRRLAAGLAGTHHALVDVGPGLSGFSLAGPEARHLLAKGMTLDLHPAAFPVGHVTRTLLAGQGVLIHARAAALYDLYVDISRRDYFQHWLRDALREFTPG